MENGMKTVKRFTSRMLAVLLAGTLTVGGMSVSAFGAEEDSGTASEIAAEKVKEEDTVSSPADAADAISSYTVTLDANGGYFANEWDDVLEEYLERTEILNKVIPAGGTVSTCPVNGQDNNDAVFLGWSLERDGELVTQEGELTEQNQKEYAPVGNCVLYAVWGYENTYDDASADSGNYTDDAVVTDDASEAGTADTVESEIPYEAATEAAAYDTFEEAVGEGSGAEDSFAVNEEDGNVEDASSAATEGSTEAAAEYAAETLQPEAVSSYMVTLDANGGYFENEWDDLLNESLESAEVINKAVPIGGTVTTFPVYGITDQDSQTRNMTFAGWSLERDGELVTREFEEYSPGSDCILYAVWTAEEFVAEETSSAGSTASETADSYNTTLPERDTDKEPRQSEETTGKQAEKKKDSGAGTVVTGKDPAKEKTNIQEEPQPEESVSSEPKMAARGSVSGNSKVTWSGNKMPASFDTTNVKLLKHAYLTTAQDGYMRVAYDGKSIVIEYFDSAFRMVKQGKLSMELNIWGGFYKGNDAYYVVEGKNNKDCVDGKEVLRIIKYDYNWKRLGAGNILAQEGWEYEIRYPFDVSCVNMTEVNGKLYLITGREGYVDDSVGQGHQGMMLIRMDEETFDTEIVYGDFWHSFAQYIDHKGKNLYICEQSEGSRCTQLSRFDSSRTGTDYFDAFSDRFSVLDYGGSHTSAWAIPCYASVDDMAISSGNVLCLGTSIDQSQYDNVSSDMAHNIYLTVTPISDMGSDSTTVKWLTDYSGGGKSFLGVNITKINGNRFLVAWEEAPDENTSVPASDSRDPLSSGVLHYVFVDGSGEKISREFTAHAMISDCHPILDGGKIVFYSSNTCCLDFYTIDAKTGKFNKSVTRIAGNNISWDYKDGILSFSGKGSISIDLKATPRYSLSSTSYWFIYDDGDNCWKTLRDKTTGIKIGKGITSIPERAFAGFVNLTDVRLPDGLTSIGKEAFYSCDALRKLSIPDSVKKIGADIVWTGSYWVGSNSHVTYATIYGNCTSYAIKYAKKNGISYNPKHKWISEITAKATTTKNGKITRKCSLCGEISSTKVIHYPKTITLSKTVFIYNGKVQKPKVTVKGSDGKIIDASNYTLQFSNGCKAAGSYSVKIVFKGNYTGSVKKSFKITTLKVPGNCRFVKWNNAKYSSCQIAWNKVEGADGYQTVLCWTNGSHAVTKNLKANALSQICSVPVNHVTMFKVRAFANLSTGKAFSQWSNIAFITPSPTTLKYKNNGTGSNPKLNISWDIIYGCDGYNVFLTTNPNGTWVWNQSTAANATATSAVVTKYRGQKLKKGTRYYVRIVTRRKRNGVFCTVPLPANNTNIGSFVVK